MSTQIPAEPLRPPGSGPHFPSPDMRSVADALRHAGLERVDAQVLLARVLGNNRAWLSAHGGDELTSDQHAAFAALAERRRCGEPVAYLTGVREFHGLELRVTPAVLIPRPETEVLVDWALTRLPLDSRTRMLDLGSGSGAIALAVAHRRPWAQVLGVDASAGALVVARDNATRLGIGNVEWRLSDWYGALAKMPAFDVIVSNPPYVRDDDPHLAQGDVRFEPAIALRGGADGLSALREVVQGALARLRPGGALAVEHGYDQAADVRALLETAGFAEVRSLRDLARTERVTCGIL